MTDVSAPIDPVAEAGYVVDQRRPHWPATIAGFEAASAAVTALPGFEADVAYGSHPRARFDWYPADGEPRAIVAYLHPGFWQMRDKTLVRCLMPLFARLGCDVASVGYPLCPDVDLAGLTETVRESVPALLAHGRAVHGRDLPLIAAGHSAGAHLAAELALTDWTARGFARSPVAGVVALSGVYDVAPLVATTLNAALRLDAARARAASPLLRVGPPGCPALFAVGGGETTAFVEQNRRMAAAWAAAGHDTRSLESDVDDHFSLITTLQDPASPLARAVAELIDTAAGAPKA